MNLDIECEPHSPKLYVYTCLHSGIQENDGQDCESAAVCGEISTPGSARTVQKWTVVVPPPNTELHFWLNQSLEILL